MVPLFSCCQEGGLPVPGISLQKEKWSLFVVLMCVECQQRWSLYPCTRRECWAFLSVHLSSPGGLLVTIEFLWVSFHLPFSLFGSSRWMKKPRCGVPDHPHLGHSRRKKRYALTGQKWRQKHITYRYSLLTPSLHLGGKKSILCLFRVQMVLEI